MKVIVVTIATGKYHPFIKPLIKSAEENLLTEHDVDYMIFTDLPNKMPYHKNIHTSMWQHREWPFPTLLRYHAFMSQRSFLSNYDYVYYCDADMKFHAPVGNEILSVGVVATIHPGFYNKPNTQFTYERNPNSTAYIPMGEGEHYFAGGFNGGSSEEFLEMSESIMNNIDKDLTNGIISVWHDESHLNHHLWLNKPNKKLDPSYCYPESWDLPFEKKLLALDKNHKELGNMGAR